MRWEMKAHPLADAEMKDLKANHPRAFQALKNTIRLLAKEQYPNNPCNPKLDICHLNRDAEGWFRLKIIGHTQWRVIVRFYKRLGKKIFVVRFEDEMDGPGQGVIQIMKVSHRLDGYRPVKARQDAVRYR